MSISYNYTMKLRKFKKSKIGWLLLSIFFLSLLITTISFSPNYTFHLKLISITAIPVFFTFLFFFVFSFATLVANKTQGILFAIFIYFYLWLRLIHLTHFLFLIITAALLFSIELLIYKKK